METVAGVGVIDEDVEEMAKAGGGLGVEGEDEKEIGELLVVGGFVEVVGEGNLSVVEVLDDGVDGEGGFVCSSLARIGRRIRGARVYISCRRA